jgi:tetratricopeptide (TPR) repeat protein
MTFDSDPYDWIYKGDNFLDSGKYGKAINCYDTAIEIDQNDVDTWTWIEIGNRLFDLAKYEDATRYYDKAIKVDKRAAWAWRNRGLALSVVGKHEEAIESYDKALRIDRYFVDAWNDKGNAFCALKKYDRAIKYFNKAIEIDPDFGDAWTRKGDALYDLRKYGEAITCYNEAVRVDRNNIWAWTYKGRALDMLGNHDEAVKQYKKAIRSSAKAIRSDPDNPYLRLAKGDSLLAIDDIPEAKKCLEKARDLDPDNVGILTRLVLLYSDYTYEHDKGIEISLRLLRIDPDDNEAKAGMAENLVAVGRYKEARKHALQVIRKSEEAVFQCVMRFLVFASYLLDGELTRSNREFTKFVKYYKGLNEDFKIEEDRWIFRGLINSVVKGNTSPQAKFLLLSLIDLLKGKIDRHILSFFLAF